MKIKMLVFLLVSFLVSSAVFSASINSVSPQIPTRTIPAIVSTEWLAANLNLPNLVILDTRSGDLYSAGHIPGAVNVPESEWYANPPFGDAFP